MSDQYPEQILETDVSQVTGSQIEIYFLCSLAPLVPMVQSADPGELNNFATFGWPGLNRSFNRRVFTEPIMGSIIMIIFKVRGQNPFQMAFVQHDDMIKAISAD